MSDYTIYGIVDEKDDPTTVVYVGAARYPKSRMTRHWRQRYDKESPLNTWLRSLDRCPDYVVLTTCGLDERDDQERYWIAHYGFDNLLNVTTGGHGFDGKNYQLDPVSRARQIAAVKKALTGRTMSDETKARISAANTGKKRTPEAREKMRQAKLGKPLSEEHRRKLGDAHRGRVHTAAARANMSAAQRGKTVSDETREKLRQAWVRRKERMNSAT